MNPVQISVARIVIALVIYGGLCGAVLWWKPKSMFEDGGRARAFGLGQAENNQSVFAPVVVFPALAVVAYFVASFWELTRPSVPRALNIRP